MSAGSLLKVKSMEEHLDLAQLQLAMRYAPTRWLPMLRKIASEIEADGDAVAAVDEYATGDCRQSLKACLEYERPFELLSQVLRWRSKLNQPWRNLRATLLYPSILLLVAVVVCTFLSSFVMKTMGEELLSYADFAISGIGFSRGEVESQLKEQELRNQAVYWMILFLGASAAAIRLLLKPFERFILISGLPGIGPMLRWNALAELLAVMGAVHDRNPKLEPVLKSTHILLGKDRLGKYAEILRGFSESGMTLKNSIQRLGLSDSMTDAIVVSLVDDQHSGSLQFDQAANLIAQLSQRQGRFIAMVAPVVLLLAIGVMIASTLVAYFNFAIMLIRVLQALS